MSEVKYKEDTPEWQLHANMVANLNLVQAYAADSERALRAMNAAQAKADKFGAALDVLNDDAIARAKGGE